MAVEQKRLARSGVDPVENRKGEAEKAAKRLAGRRTFEECATAYIDAHRHSWKNGKHAWQWTNTLERFAFPVIGKKDVAEVTTDDVLRILEPIWNTITETATRVRSRIENVLDSAKARGYRDGENPARWRGHLSTLLAAKPKKKRVVHHPAMHVDMLPTFMVELAAQTALSARALEFTIHTALRTNEVLGAQWSEIDMTNRVWKVPASRMKMALEHSVPLTDEALSILQAVRGLDARLVFPGQKSGKQMSGRTMIALLERMGQHDITVHGFRSTFTDYLSERHEVSREVREMALAHGISDEVEAAYRRGDLYAKRRDAMRLWSSYLVKGDESLPGEAAEGSGLSEIENPTNGHPLIVR
ncbi:site-specific integrase [Pseudomonas sp. S36]|nr:site-specific integrase [Pseudomonas sp. S36]